MCPGSGGSAQSLHPIVKPQHGTVLRLFSCWRLKTDLTAPCGDITAVCVSGGMEGWRGGELEGWRAATLALKEHPGRDITQCPVPLTTLTLKFTFLNPTGLNLSHPMSCPVQVCPA